MVITVVCLPNVHCSLPMSTGLCCTNVHCSSPVTVFCCFSSLLSAVSLSNCCRHLKTDVLQFRQYLLLTQPCFCEYLNSPMPGFWHSPIFAITQFHTSPDFCQCLIIAGTHILPILDSIWIPNVANTLFLVKRFLFSCINNVIYVDQYRGTIK